MSSRAYADPGMFQRLAWHVNVDIQFLTYVQQVASHRAHLDTHNLSIFNVIIRTHVRM